MTLRIHRGAERRFAPWKNGGGETAEIVCYPSGAGMDDFGWRISTARVAQSGPFSSFPGVGRTLAVIEGGSLTLRLTGKILEVSADSAPVQFDGGTPCACTLNGAPVLDLNLMTRAPFAGRISRGWSQPDPAENTVACFVLLLDSNDREGLCQLDLIDMTDVPQGSQNPICGPRDILIRIAGP